MHAALHEHFIRKSTDPTLDGRERSTFSGLAKKLESPVFIKNLGLMLDALEELSNLSLALPQVEVFSARTACESEHYSEAYEAVTSGEFKGITLLSNDTKQPEIPKGQFYQALPDAMSARLMPETEKALSRAADALNPETYCYG